MGRRKRRRDSDVDLTVEETHYRTRSVAARQVVGKKPNKASPSGGGHDANLSLPTDGDLVPSQSVASASNDQPEKDKIEALRRKKEARKERRKEKRALKKQESQEAHALKEASKQRPPAKRQKKIESELMSLFIPIRKGVEYQDVVIGKGPMVQVRKKVRVAYVLRKEHRYGKILDSSNDFSFCLGRGEVIEGWDIGVQGMRLGGKRYLIVEPEAGYGNKDVGGGPGATLFFEVTVVACYR